MFRKLCGASLPGLRMQATRNIADAALAFRRLRGFVHLSTAYVNCNRPCGSHVQERLYRFHADGEADSLASCEACHASSTCELEGVEALAQELAALPEAAASQRVSTTQRLLTCTALPQAGPILLSVISSPTLTHISHPWG